MMTPQKWGGWAALGWLLCSVSYFIWDERVAIPIGIISLFFTFGVVASLANGNRQ